jgi:hypothetical protein
MPDVRATTRLHLSHEIGDMGVQLYVPRVVVDAEVPDTSTPGGDVSVPEVPAEQLGVRGLVEHGSRAPRAPGGGVTLSALESAPLVQAAPPPNRLDGHAMEGRIVGVAHPRVGRRESIRDNCIRSHMSHILMVVEATDNGAGCGSRTRTLFRATLFESAVSTVPPTRPIGRPTYRTAVVGFCPDSLAR